MTQLNIENINKLADYMDGLAPEKFDMANWCGSACCISGWAAVLNGAELRPDDVLDGLHFFIDGEFWLQSDACRWIGIDEKQGDLLFTFISNTSSKLNMGTAKPWHAAAVLRHLAATGEVDWSVADNITGPSQKQKPLPESITSLLTASQLHKETQK